jgi:putative glycosyltransferase (TIGR04348 family)
MKIGIITPAPPQSRYGNRVTALRWARILRNLGHRASIRQTYDGADYDLLIALHARRSYASITRFHHKHRGAPLVVALTGTDLYRDLASSSQAQRSLELATRIIVLQPKALEEVKAHLRDKVRVIYQSASIRPDCKPPSAAPNHFEVVVIGHLRAVKDPFRTAMAARLLPASSRIRVWQVGGAMSQAMAARAQREMKLNPRYHWLGEQSRSRTHRLLARSDLCVISSRMEGGANVVSEAIVASVPLLASRIPGTIGLLGEDYPGYFEVGNTRELARLLMCAETDPAFLAELKAHCQKLIPLFHPAREQQAWVKLLGELFHTPTRERGEKK